MNLILETSLNTGSDWCEDKLDAMLAADDLLYEIEEKEQKEKWKRQNEVRTKLLLEKDDQKFLENEARERRRQKAIDAAVSSFHNKQVAVQYQSSLSSLEEARARYLASKQPKRVLEVVAEEKPVLTIHRGRGKFRAIEKIYSKPGKSLYERFVPKLQRFAAAAGLVAMLVPSMSLTPHRGPTTLSLSPVRVEKVEDAAEPNIDGIGGVFENYVIANSEPYLTSGFGKRDLPKKVPGSAIHMGNDYRARVGDKNISPLDGTVIDINRGYSRNGKSGMSISILSSDSSLIVKNFHGYISKKFKVGSKVKAGDTVSVVAPKKHSGVDPHSHWEAIAVGGKYEKVRGQHVDVFCLASDETKERVIRNLENRLERKLDLPSGLKYLPGRTVREKMENSCELQSYQIVYGGYRLPTQTISSNVY